VLATVLSELACAQPPRGVRIDNALVSGDLVLTALDFPSDLGFRRCRFTGVNLSLVEARIRSISLVGGCEFQGRLNLAGARVEEDLDMTGAFFRSGIDLTGAVVHGAVVATDLRAWSYGGQPAIAGGRLQVDGSMFIDHSQGASGEPGPASPVEGDEGGGPSIHGQLALSGASIRGELRVDQQVQVPGGAAFTAMKLSVGRLLTVHGSIQGSVRLDGADIEGELNATELDLTAPGPWEAGGAISLSAANSRIGGALFLNKCDVAGTVCLREAKVGGQLNATSSRFGAKGLALAAAGLSVTGPMYLNGETSRAFYAAGLVELCDSHVTGQLDLEKAELAGGVDLRDATVGPLTDQEAQWSGPLRIDGFVYARLPDSETWQHRAQWLRMASKYSAQPWQQAAKVYLASGRDVDARKLTVAGQNARLKTEPPANKSWKWLLRVTTGYGHEPLRLVPYVAFLLALVTGLSYYAIRHNELVAVNPPVGATHLQSAHCQPKVYLCPNAFLYSLDVVVPVVNLHQRDNWTVDTGTAMGQVVDDVDVVAMFAGWSIAALAGAALTGVLKMS
jgi:hypothetical protein